MEWNLCKLPNYYYVKKQRIVIGNRLGMRIMRLVDPNTKMARRHSNSDDAQGNLDP
jgi:hypothetical protein